MQQSQWDDQFWRNKVRAPKTNKQTKYQETMRHWVLMVGSICFKNFILRTKDSHQVKRKKKMEKEKKKKIKYDATSQVNVKELSRTIGRLFSECLTKGQTT